MPEDTAEKSLSTQTLRHALAFKDNSTQLFHDALNQVRAFIKIHNDIFPPKYFPSWREPIASSTIQHTSCSSFHGRLTPPEAASVIMLLNETTAIAQSFGRDHETSLKICDALRIPKGGWQADVFEGMSDFGNRLGIAAGVRERMLNREGRPKGKTLGDSTKRDYWDTYHKAIQEDGFVLGKRTAEAIVQSSNAYAETFIRQVPEAAKNQKEIQARIDSRKHGIELAWKLYIEALNLTATVLPPDVSQKDMHDIPPALLSSKNL